MSYFEKYDHMVKLKLDVKSILKLVKKEYRKLRNNEEWPVANHARDSKLGSRGYKQVNVAATNELKRLVNSLIKADDKPKVKESCHNCEKERHRAKDCPEPKREYKS